MRIGVRLNRSFSPALPPPPATLSSMPPTNRDALFRNLLAALTPTDGSPTAPLPGAVVEEASTTERFILTRLPSGDYTLRIASPDEIII